MRISLVAKVVVTGFFYLCGSHACECNIQQPRKEGDPPAKHISAELHRDLELVCKRTQLFNEYDKLQDSFDHGGKFDLQVCLQKAK